MDRHTAAIYKRGAVAIVPILAIVGCRVGLRACVAVDRSDRRHETSQAFAEQAAQAARDRDRAEELAAAAKAEDDQRARARRAASGAPSSQSTALASGQGVPDSLAIDTQHVAWANTRSGEIMVMTRSESKSDPAVIAKDQKLLQRRHGQSLALAGGYVYWITASLTTAAEEEGAIYRASLRKDGGAAGEPELVATGLGGLSALVVDKDSVYYARGLRVSRDEDGGATGGVYRIKLGPKGQPAKEPQRVLAAERPCAIAVDETSIYAVEPQKLWRAPKGKGEAKAIVSGAERLACTIAVDADDVYWTIPSDDSVMRAKKTDGSGIGVVAFTRKRPTNVVVDKGYAYVLTETSPQALGEQGNVFKVALRSERLTPRAVVTDQVGLESIAAQNGFVVFSGYNEAETDGTVSIVNDEPSASPYKRGN